MTDDLRDASRALAGKSAGEVLAWAATNAGPRIGFATGFGAEGCVIIDLIARASLPIDVLTLDTGLLFPETYALWQALEARYGIVIRGVTPERTVEQQTEDDGPTLWAREPDRCCEQRKVKPLRDALVGLSAWVTAIRRDQTPERASAEIVEHDAKFGLIKINPLVAWTHDDVWAHLHAHDVPFNPLHEQGYPSIGCQPCTSKIVPGENLRAGRWRDASKRECGIHVADPDAAQRTNS